MASFLDFLYNPMDMQYTLCVLSKAPLEYKTGNFAFQIYYNA